MTTDTLALFLPNWIGDVVMATPAIRAVREHFPTTRLLAVCKPYVAETLAGAPWIDRVIPTGPGQMLSTIRDLRHEHTRVAVLFPNSFRSALVARLGGCETVVGFARYFRDALLSKRLYPTRGRNGRPKPMPVIDDYNRIVQRLGVPDPGHRMQLFTTPADEAAANSVWNRLGLNRFARVVGLNPGGAFGAAKHWPTAYFVQLARHLAQQSLGVVALCGPAEREIANQIAREAGVVSLGDSQLSLGLTKAMVRRLALLVTTDSGPRHFAAAFQVPVVTLFGPTHIEWTETRFRKAIHLQHVLPCGPCQQRICPLGHHRCMTELTVAEVATAAEQLLQTFMEERRHAG